ncbi:MAG: hypothetical protein NWR37_02920, partial [Algoriphagus sp.]|nr:hypothetical protein [Algoriphagus sp.]
LHPWDSQPFKKEVRFSGVNYLFAVRNRKQSFAPLSAAADDYLFFSRRSKRKNNADKFFGKQ